MNSEENTADREHVLKILNGETSGDFEIWQNLLSAFTVSLVSERKVAIDAYYSLLRSYSDFRLNLTLLRITELRDRFSGEEWLLSERMVSDLLEEMSERDGKEFFENAPSSPISSESVNSLAKVIDLRKYIKSLN